MSHNPPQLAQFRHIRRSWDVHRKMHVANIHPGELYITEKHELISTLLGSCIAVCMRDKFKGIGGMNHFRLPTRKGRVSNGMDTNYGIYAMEMLINEIMKHGGKKHHLECAVFGGGNVIQNMTSDIGGKNIDFVMSFLKKESIPVIHRDVGHTNAQKVYYHPMTGFYSSVVQGMSSLVGVKKAEQEYVERINKEVEESTLTYF